MTMSFGKMSESHWEAFAMDTLGELAWHTAEGKAIAPGSGERESWDELIIPHRVRDAIDRINPQLPPSAVDEALNIVLTAKSRDARGENRQVHEYLTKGIRSVVYTDAYGAEQNPTIHLLDPRDPYANDFLAVNQVSVIDGDHKRRFDIVLYVNGLPLGLILHGLFEQGRFIELLKGYVAFARSDNGLIKRLAKPHQYFAVSKAVDKTIEAVRSDGHAGVVWHTQGSGKSLEMELYANQVLTHPSLGNPTIVVLTDRTDLDDQLYDTFEASELLPDKPHQVATRDELRTELASRQSGGIIFTTLQKFGRTKAERDAGESHPLLSDRRNIIVIVDEAYRSHYDDLNGYARHLRDALPHATMIAFTGTPISTAERDTQLVFGDYIDVYDLTRA